MLNEKLNVCEQKVNQEEDSLIKITKVKARAMYQYKIEDESKSGRKHNNYL